MIWFIFKVTMPWKGVIVTLKMSHSHGNLSPCKGYKKLVVSGFAFVLYNGVIQRKSSGNDEGECDC